MMRKILTGLLLFVGLFAFGQEDSSDVADEGPVVIVEESAPPVAVLSRNSDVVLTKDNTITLNDYFYGESVANLTQQAKDLDAKLPSNEPIYLVLNSGGGSIEAGIEAIQNLNTLNRPINTITLFSASMGFQTVQGVKGERLVTKNGTLMSHKARGFFYGEFPGQLDSRYGHYLKRVTRLDKDVVSRTAGKHTLESYAKLIENEYWCDGADCLEQGLADRVVNPSCDQSMQGSHSKLWDRWIYYGHTIEIVDIMSNCPLITDPLSYNIFIDGEPLFNSLANLTTDKKENDEGYSFYSLRSNSTAIRGLDEQTVLNIKNQIDEKIATRKVGVRPAIRYY